MVSKNMPEDLRPQEGASRSEVKEFEKKPEAKDYVYVRFKDDDQFESMWVKILQGTQQQGYGELNNIPVKLVDRKLGDTISYKTDKEGVTWERKD